MTKPTASGGITCEADIPVEFNYPGIPTEDLIAELKKRGLGVFNLSLPFRYEAKNNLQETPKDNSPA